MSKKFNLNTEIHRKNIFFYEKNLITDVIISRAFKPLPIIFKIAKQILKILSILLLFLGKSGKKILNDAFKIWKFDYEKKKNKSESII